MCGDVDVAVATRVRATNSAPAICGGATNARFVVVHEFVEPAKNDASAAIPAPLTHIPAQRRTARTSCLGSGCSVI
jgi:hypothetical protein